MTAYAYPYSERITDAIAIKVWRSLVASRQAEGTKTLSADPAGIQETGSAKAE